MNRKTRHVLDPGGKPGHWFGFETHNKTSSSTRTIKIILLWAIILCFVILCYQLFEAKPKTDLVNVIWTEENTRYPHIEPQERDEITLTRLYSEPEIMKPIDDYWISAMKNSKIVSVDFDFTKGFSEKYRVVFDSGHVAVVRLNT